jgi:uncharacterized protein
MSGLPEVRRADKLMLDEEARAFLEGGYCGRMATVGPDGWPYVVPLLYVVMDGKIFTHNTRAVGHLRENVDHEERVCFEVDAPGQVFPYGRFECDTSVAYESVVVFGRTSVVEDEETKARFCRELMRKYGDGQWGRPEAIFPRLPLITVYATTIERITGKRTPLPAPEERWPAVDRTRTPNAGT